MAFPVIVIGSGPAGVQASASLLEAGRSVLMIDAGLDSDSVSSLQDASLDWGDWGTLRAQRNDQYRLFWGENFEGIPWGEMRAGAGLTPGRRHTVAGVEDWIPIQSKSFKSVESLSVGGLGGAWGLGAFALSDAELRSAGLSAHIMREGYRRTALRIGISGTDQGAADVLTPGVSDLLPALKLDPGATQLWERYQKAEPGFRARGVVAGKTPLALLSQPFRGREATRYADLDFYSDQGRSAYRPRWTLEELATHQAFERVQGVLVSEVFETADAATVLGLSRQTREIRKFQGSDVILCAGALGSARILLRSTERHQKRKCGTGLICSPYSYLMGVRLGGAPISLAAPRHSMGQLVIACGSDHNMTRLSVLGSVLSYRSLLLTRLLARSPLPLKDSRRLLQVLQSRLQVTGAFFPDDGSGGTRHLSLVADSDSPTQDRLEVVFNWGQKSSEENSQQLRRLRGVLMRLGCPTIAEVDPGVGGSIHYAGTVPFSKQPLEGRLSCSPESALVHGYRRVRVGDGSAFRTSPAAGITWSLMAFADQVGRALGENRSLC